MPKQQLTQAQKTKITSFLQGYETNKKMLALSEYEQNFFNSSTKLSDMPSEEPLARAKMYTVRHFILSLSNSDEKLFLYYHYIKKLSVSRCAEMLGISERSGFRLKDRALCLAYKQLMLSDT